MIYMPNCDMSYLSYYTELASDNLLKIYTFAFIHFTVQIQDLFWKDVFDMDIDP